MSISSFVRGQYLGYAMAREKKRVLRQPGPERLERSDWERSLTNPSEYYLDCFRFFHQRLPVELREHRAYFFKDQKGYGEDAMHVMWFRLFQEFKPASFLEIGVFRGQTLSLAAMLARINGVPCLVQGISPFSAAGDRGTTYRGGIDYLEDTLANFAHFGLPKPELFKGFSNDNEAFEVIHSRAWDMIYIDGNHDYEVVRHDWEVCSQSVRRGGIIVLDDSGLGTAYQPPVFATTGQAGPSQVARELDREQFREILQVGHNRVFQRAG